MGEKYIISGGPEVEFKTDLSFGQVIKNFVLAAGDNVVQICATTGKITSASELLALSTRLAEVLQAQGVGPGDVVALSSENRVEFTVVVIATLFVGATIAPINYNYVPNEVQHAFYLSEPKIVFCSPWSMETILKVSRENSSVKQIIVFGNTSPVKGVQTLKTFVADCTVPAGSDFPVTPVDPVTQTAAIMLSSGTTGLPKGVEITHRNLNVCIGLIITSLSKLTPLIDIDNITISLIPWFHNAGFILHLAAIIYRMKNIVMGKFNEKLFLESIQNHKVTYLLMVPPLMVFLAKHPMVLKYDLSSVLLISCGAASLSKETEEAVQKRINVPIRQVYGMTETTLGILQRSPGELGVPGSCGKVAPGMLCKVIDVETAQILGPNKQGELCFKGPLIMKGYIRNPEATDAMIDSQGWLHTGDIGYYDEDKYFFVIDRLKELIKYKGFQVAPAELEALLLTHPGVKDAAVIGILDDQCGELPLAYIARQPNSKVTDKELIDFVASKVSRTKRLHGGVRFVEEIPKNPSGKILRRVLRDLSKKQTKSKL